ncbi:MAG: HAMP domain-containing protein [Lachnospiraceae bacterium]|nr:HAMP domain-containing protein [Lachnospiraceae bacterium]
MKTKVRTIRLRTKIAIAVLATALLVGIMVGSFSLMKLKSDMMELSIAHTRDVAQMAASFMDPEILTNLEPGQEDSEAYQEMLERLSAFLVDDSDIAYIYTMRKRNGIVEFVVDADQEEGAAIGDPYESYDVIENALAGEVSVDKEVTTDEWGSVYSGFAPVFAKDGSVAAIVGVDCSVDVINSRVLAMLRTMIIIEVTVFLIALAIALSVGRLMTKNVLLINNKMDEMARSGGDLTQTIEVKSGDELEATAEHFNEFLGKLHDIILSVRETEEQLFEFSRQTEEQIVSADGQLSSISGAIGSMSESLAATSVSAQNVSDAASNAAMLLAEVNEQAVQSGEHAKASGERALSAKEKCAGDLQKVTTVVEKISDEMEKQTERSRKIHEINKLTGEIVGISNQTQLLALNASIEAARAGEAGRGFAVVAEEISKLADATTKTAKEIGDINRYTVETVEELVQTTQRMVSYIRDEVYSDYREMEKIGADYHADTGDFADRMQQMQSLSGQLTSDMEKIRESLYEMTRMTGEETENIAVVSSTAENISQTMKSVRADAQINERIITKMGELIGQFRV